MVTNLKTSYLHRKILWNKSNNLWHLHFWKMPTRSRVILRFKTVIGKDVGRHDKKAKSLVIDR